MLLLKVSITLQKIDGELEPVHIKLLHSSNNYGIKMRLTKNNSRRVSCQYSCRVFIIVHLIFVMIIRNISTEVSVIYTIVSMGVVVIEN